MGDSGVGIPAEHLRFLFDRFWQANQHKRAGPGLDRFIGKAHGGAIAVERSPGAGKSFTLALPAALAPECLALAVTEQQLREVR